jgi:hypothetical protein
VAILTPLGKVVSSVSGLVDGTGDPSGMATPGKGTVMSTPDLVAPKIRARNPPEPGGGDASVNAGDACWAAAVTKHRKCSVTSGVSRRPVMCNMTETVLL